MKTLKETIMANEVVTRFASHFETKSSIKNILTDFPGNKKTVLPLFEDEKYSLEILGYGSVEEKLTTVVNDAFVVYTDYYLNNKGNNPGMVTKVQLFLGMINDRMEKNPGKDIVSELGEFAKSATGKEIEKIISDSGIKEDVDDVLMDMLIIIAARRIIINAVAVEKMEPEAVVNKDGSEVEIQNSARHHEEKKTDKAEQSEQEPTKEPTTEVSNVKFKMSFNELIGKLSNAKEEEIPVIIKSIRPVILNNIDEFKKLINNSFVIPRGCYQTILSALPGDKVESVNGFNLDKLVRYVSNIVPLEDYSDEGLRLHFAVTANMFYRTLDCILNPEDENKFVELVTRVSLMIDKGAGITSASNYNEVMKMVGDTETIWSSVYYQIPKTGNKDELYFIGAGASEASAKATLKTLFKKIRAVA